MKGGGLKGGGGGGGWRGRGWSSEILNVPIEGRGRGGRSGLKSGFDSSWYLNARFLSISINFVTIRLVKVNLIVSSAGRCSIKEIAEKTLKTSSNYENSFFGI